jgi:predicted phosphatase
VGEDHRGEIDPLNEPSQIVEGQSFPGNKVRELQLAHEAEAKADVARARGKIVVSAGKQ